MRKLYLSIVIPSYNEEANLRRGVLSEIREFMKKKDFSWEVVVSDDGSTDKSKDIVKKKIKKWKDFRLLENKHGGKPVALYHGIKAAKGEYVLFTDVDQSTPIEELDKLLPFVEKGYDVVIGSRKKGRKNFPFYRKLGSFVFLSIRKNFVLSDIKDTQCGFKLFKKELLEEAFPKLEFFRKERDVKGWSVSAYDVELLHILEKMGEKIAEVKVEWEDRDISESKGGGVNRYFRESWDMLKQIVRVKLNDMSGMYDVN